MLIVPSPFLAVELAYSVMPTLFIDVLGYEPWYLIRTDVDHSRGRLVGSLLVGLLAFVGRLFARRSILETQDAVRST